MLRVTYPCPVLSLRHAHCSSEKNLTFGKTQRGCQHGNLVSTLGVAQRDGMTPHPPPLSKF